MSSKNCRVKPGRAGLLRGLGLAAFLLATLPPPLAVAQGAFRVGERLAPAAAAGGAETVEWAQLLPADWNPKQALDGVDLASLSDNDPRANELLARLRADLDRAPVVKGLDGKRVRIAGFVVTLERNDRGVSEFLLVPYYGACIHTPPPPANQIVHVLPEAPVAPETAIFPVWITGTLKTVAAVTAEGAAGYRITDAKVEPYPWRQRR